MRAKAEPKTPPTATAEKPSTSSKQSVVSAARPPRWGFFKGAAVGLLVGVPAVATAVYLLAHVGYGDPSLSLTRAMRLTVLFAGIATVLAAGGVGRLCAVASVDGRGGKYRPVWVGARTFAVAGTGLVIIAAIPNGSLPGDRGPWIVIAIAGALAGGLVGAIIGLASGGPPPLSLHDVLDLARRPTDALRDLMDPRRHDADAPTNEPAPKPDRRR